MNINIKDKEYKIIKDVGDTISTIDLSEYVTDFYDKVDYIVGDWAYGKLRLKGFYNHDNKKLVKSYNDYKNLDKYIEDYCAYGCKYFVLELITKTIEKKQ